VQDEREALLLGEAFQTICVERNVTLKSSRSNGDDGRDRTAGRTSPMPTVAPTPKAKSGEEWLLRNLRKREAAPRKKFQPQDLTALRSEAHRTLAHRWSRGAWKSKRSVWGQYETFLLVNYPENPSQLLPELEAPVLFLQSLQVKDTSRYSYACSLRQMLRGVGVTIPTMFNWWVEALGRKSEAETELSARPITRAQVEQLLADPSLTQEEKLVIWLAWKTASRISEVLALRKGSFMEVNPTEAIIFWGFRCGVKTAKVLGKKYGIQHFVHLRDQYHPELMEQLTCKVRSMRNRTARLFQGVTYQRVLTMVRKLEQPTLHDPRP
jgi:integrase